ncbi:MULTISPECIES: DUF535 family protein [unclassified Zymobacter]|uniref:DUF535 family protein n=1 Tax=unclassified Zymobacter TaxID=3048685 RepID=UPI0039C216D4
MSSFKQWKHRLKCAFLSARIGQPQQDWLRALADNPQFGTLAAGDEQFSYRHFKAYLNRHLTAAQKLSIVHHTAQRLCDVLSKDRFDTIFTGKGLLLATLPFKDGEGEARVIMRRATFPREGEIGLFMETDEEGVIYQLNFSLAPPATLLIGGLQGPRPEQGDIIKRYNKALHGLRPQNVMVSAMYACALVFEADGVKGITETAHPRRKRLKSSYDRFWAENGGEEIKGGWFQLPPAEPERDIQQVKSQRRAAFRRREALREDMARQIVTALGYPERMPALEVEEAATEAAV